MKHCGVTSKSTPATSSLPCSAPSPPRVPPVPKKLVDPRPNIGLAAKTCDAYVRPDGLMFVSDWNAGMHVLQYQGCEVP